MQPSTIFNFPKNLPQNLSEFLIQKEQKSEDDLLPLISTDKDFFTRFFKCAANDSDWSKQHTDMMNKMVVQLKQDCAKGQLTSKQARKVYKAATSLFPEQVDFVNESKETLVTIPLFLMNARCCYFRDMLNGPLKEGTSKTIFNGYNLSLKALNFIKAYLEMRVIDLANLEENDYLPLLEAAVQYDLPVITFMISQFVIVDKDNFEHAIQLAQGDSSQSFLYKAVHHFALTHQTEAICPAFLPSPQTQPELNYLFNLDLKYSMTEETAKDFIKYFGSPYLKIAVKDHRDSHDISALKILGKYVTIYSPNLTDLQKLDETLQYCPNIETLDLSGCDFDLRLAMAPNLSGLKRLKNLIVNECCYSGGELVQSIIANNPHLEHLSLGMFKNSPKDGIKTSLTPRLIRNLKTLRCGANVKIVIPQDDSEFPYQLPLRSLELDLSEQHQDLDPVLANFPKLEKLTLNNLLKVDLDMEMLGLTLSKYPHLKVTLN